MNKITDFIKYELYPELYNSIDTVFTEHNFKKTAQGWKSKTYLNGAPHKIRTDKTVVTKKSIGHILEQGGPTKSLVDYVMERDNIEFIEAVKKLAGAVGLSIPTSTDFNKEDYISYKNRATVLEDCNSYFTYCLFNSTNAEEVLEYLDSRGYSVENVKDMELGFIPSQEQTIKHLLSKKHPQKLIDEVLKLNYNIGSTHKLTIPYRSGGDIKGFKFRTIGAETPKYINSTGLDRNGGFFNLSAVTGDKDLIIVEGELDSLACTVRGVDNVVSTGGSSISSEQIKNAIKRGAKSFTLCFDYDPQAIDKTKKNIKSAIDIIRAEGVNNVYLITLVTEGADKVDVDSFIKDNGIDNFKVLIKNAIPYYDYFLSELIIDLAKYEDENLGVPTKCIDKFLEDAVSFGATIKEPLDKDRYKNTLLSYQPLRELGITPEALNIAVDRLSSKREVEEQNKSLEAVLKKAKTLQDKGDIKEALELLEDNTKKIKLKDKATEFSKLLIPIKEDEIRDRERLRPEPIKSGYKIGEDDLFLPAGAITTIAGPTSHGKTTFLINLALNTAKELKDKSVYFFSYEEDRDSILYKSLNSYIDEPISRDNKKSIRTFYKTGSTEFINSNYRDIFLDKKEEFFRDYIDNSKLNIIYSNYDNGELISAIRYIAKHQKVGAVFIDYIQLLKLAQGGKYKTYSRQEEVKVICNELKDLAVETGLPIVVGAQFNREVNNQLKIHATKIGEAGDIERISNTILGFWNNNFKPIIGDKESSSIEALFSSLGYPEQPKNTIYTKVLKSRDNEVGRELILDFNGNHGTIKNTNKTTASNFGGVAVEKPF